MTEPLPPAGPPRRERREEVVDERGWYTEPAWIVAIIAFVVLLIVLAVFLERILSPDEPDRIVLDPEVEDEVEEPIEVDVTTPEVEVTPTPASTPTPTPLPQLTVPPDVEEEDGPEPVQADGAGSGVVEVEHEGGLAVLRMRHEGESFSLRILDEDGEPVEDFEVAASGDYQGSRALGLEAGDYRLGIEADGGWALSFEQPRYVAGQSLPLTIEGRNDTATNPFQTEGGQVRFTWTMDRPAELVVRVLDSDGEERAELTGHAGGEIVVDLEEGLYVLDVQGEGIWQIELS